MARLCERPGCSERGAIAYGFDAERLLVWLIALDPAADRNRAGVLCLRHGDAMVVPVGWTLDDARDPTPRLFKEPRPTAPRTSRRRSPSRKPAVSTVDSAPANEQLPLAPTGLGNDGPAPIVEPSRDRTVAAVTGVAAAAAEDPDATTAIPWMPDFDETDDLGGVLDARSPLLARAFRGTDRRR